LGIALIFLVQKQILHLVVNQEIASRGKYLGYHISNNQAEYQGLISGLKYLVRKDFSCNILYIRGDAEIVIRQMEGQYNVNSPNIRPYYERAYDLLEQVDKYTYKFRHVYRHKNWEADELANEAIQNAHY
jgi:ribonuclease HI